MTVKIYEVRSALITVWGSGAPTLNDVEASLIAAQALHGRIHKPLTLIGVLSPSTHRPSAEVRERMQNNWPKLTETCVSIQYVNLIPKGFLSSGLMSMITHVFALTNHNRTLQMHSAIVPALNAAAHADPELFRYVPDMRRVIDRALHEIADAAETP